MIGIYCIYLLCSDISRIQTNTKQVADDEKKLKDIEKAKKKAAKAELAKAKEEKRLLREKEGFKRWEFNEPEFVTKNFREYSAAMKIWQIIVLFKHILEANIWAPI